MKRDVSFYRKGELISDTTLEADSMRTITAEANSLGELHRADRIVIERTSELPAGIRKLEKRK